MQGREASQTAEKLLLLTLVFLGGDRALVAQVGQSGQRLGHLKRRVPGLAGRWPDLCGGFPMDNARGAVFTATVAQNPPSGSLVDFRFKYRNPAAKGKVDTNCTDANEPKRNDAATCGASWSQTVRDP